MDYIKANYERLLLLLSGLALLAISFLAVSSFSSLESEYQSPPVSTRGAPFVPDAALARLQGEAGKIADPSKSLWKERDRSLFVSRIYLLRDRQLVDVFESDTKLIEGIENQWILKYGLDYTDPSLGEKDPDNDGFSNLEESKEQTNPRDESSKPSVLTKLRLTDVKVEKLRVRFEGLTDGTLDRVSINTVRADNPNEKSGGTQFYPRSEEHVRIETGEEIKMDRNIILLAETRPDMTRYFSETPLKFVRAGFNEPTFDPNLQTEVQTPYVILQDRADGKELRLEHRKLLDSPYSLATLQDTRTDGKTYQLRAGETFELEGETYRLVSVSPEDAIIENVATGKRSRKTLTNPAIRPADASE
jgi:deoxycytidine triphosphate deaminase